MAAATIIRCILKVQLLGVKGKCIGIYRNKLTISMYTMYVCMYVCIHISKESRIANDFVKLKLDTILEPKF